MGITERKLREKALRKTAILKAAKKVILAKGMYKATMDDIALAAELSKGTLYQYFQNKEDIHFALCRQGAEALLKEMHEGIRNQSNGFEKLLVMAYVFIRFSKQQKRYFNLFVHFEGKDLSKLNIDEESLKRYFTEESPFALILHVIKEGMQDGSIINMHKPNVLTATLWSQMLGLLLVLNDKNEVNEIFDVNEEEIIETHVNLIFKGIHNVQQQA